MDILSIYQIRKDPTNWTIIPISRDAAPPLKLVRPGQAGIHRRLPASCAYAALGLVLLSFLLEYAVKVYAGPLHGLLAQISDSAPSDTPIRLANQLCLTSILRMCSRTLS